MKSSIQYLCLAVILVISLIYMRPLIIYNLYNIQKYKTIRTNELKYILLWTSPHTVPFTYMDEGTNVFRKRNCAYTNCYVTSDRKYLGDYRKFDVIMFAGPEILNFSAYDILPKLRSQHQRYVFASIEAPAYYPVCTKLFDNYFNWTWTFKLNSDLRWGYIIIRDVNNEIVGPSENMNWIPHEDMQPVSDELMSVLRGKTKLAAWFVSNCHTKSRRERFASKLDDVLTSKYNLSVDVYGKCGPMLCPKEDALFCEGVIKRDYFFYLSFENAESVDYVTEKLLHAVRNNAVPVVYGGANYSRFLPDGSYLNAKSLGVENLAAKMFELFNDFNSYAEYFKWCRHYTYHDKNEGPETDDYCSMCALLNSKQPVKKYDLFKLWWNPNCNEHKRRYSRLSGLLPTRFNK